MPSLFWDASGLAKGYTEEIGCETADLLFRQMPALPMLTTSWGYVETFSLLQRKYNDKRLSKKLFDEAISRLRMDFFDQPQFRLLSVTDTILISGVTYIQKYSLNSIDAALLATLLRYAATTGEICVLIAADNRFCRSALAEGLEVVNPELMPTDAVPRFFAGLN